MLTLDTLATTWGGQELRYAHLGDQRLKARAMSLVNALVATAGAPLPAVLATPTALQAAYRFFAHDAVTDTALLTAHRERTLDRIRPLDRILLIQDTTELDYTTHPATTGLGSLACARCRGLLVHSTLAATPDGLPLGLLDQQVWTRDPADTGKASQRRTRPQDDKESQRWLDALAASHRDIPAPVRTVTIADREADCYALFAVARPTHADLLIRARHPRTVTVEATGDTMSVWHAVRQATPDARPLTVTVPIGQTSRTREARLTLRCITVTLHAPQRAPGRVPHVQVVLAEEEHPPVGVAPIGWLLLTTLPVPDRAAAVQCVRWYARRWLIERYHYVLKSGCGLERVQLETAEHLRTALALYSTVAWRLLFLTYLGRQAPDTPAAAVFPPDELAVLAAAVAQRVDAATTSPRLATAIRWVARLGGFLGRPSDGEPGVKVLWRGLRKLQDLLEGVRLAALINASPHSPPSG
jgi:hypothetical protein